MRILVLKKERSRAGWTLVELMVAVAFLGVVFVSLFAGLAFGFKTVQTSREDLRATQILTQKIESIRLCTFSQLTNQVPTTFQETYSSSSGTSVIYHGTINVAPNPNLSTMGYNGNVMLVTVTVTWTTATTGASQTQISHSRSMQTLSAYYGLQNYIYGANNSI